MAPLTDPDQWEQIRAALFLRRVAGFVEWLRRPEEWLRENLDGLTSQAIDTAMFEHVEAGGEIDRTPEKRDRYRDEHEFHFDFRLTIDGRRLYIETVLDCTRTGPTLTIVNMHDA
jgi:hypothetical protein